MKLVIVESPAKTKTIKQYLGNNYDVVATKGHIRDIANEGKDNLGIDEKNQYKPIYSVIGKQQATINMINKAIEKADTVYLATDPDREGEAISWHLSQVLKLDDKYVKRIEFNEITENAILKAIDHPRDINENLFKSQETRKIFDRVIGFKLSQLLKKRSIGESAGRVQSACLKIITDREKEINEFIPKVHYEVELELDGFSAKLQETGKKKVKEFDRIEDAQNVIDRLSDIYVISDINVQTKKEKSGIPFTTSALYQAALNKYSMQSKRTAKIAQELYEGIEIKGRHIALITYIRTDSTRISDDFKGTLYNYICETYGKEYANTYAKESKKNDNIQDAHEAIRAVSLRNTKESVKDFLTPDQYKVYSLIFDQTVESMMKDSITEVKTVTINNNDYEFSLTFEKTIFDGYKINRKFDIKNQEFEKQLGDLLKVTKNPECVEKKTKAPSRFTEATIIKEMESKGIGRPSTYVSTIETLKVRKYISIEKKSIAPTEEGFLVSRFLNDHFDDIINVEYTAEMEKTLDDIENGDKNEYDVVKEFYPSFMNKIELEKKNIVPMETGEVCPLCGSKMVYKFSFGSKFEACSNYPTCKYIKKQEPKILKIKCPDCETGYLTEKIAGSGKYKGKKFYGCTNYPACKFTTSTLTSIKKK